MTKPKQEIEEDVVLITQAEYRALKKDSVLLKAVRDAGYLSGHAGSIVMGIANLEYKWHLM